MFSVQTIRCDILRYYSIVLPVGEGRGGFRIQTYKVF